MRVSAKTGEGVPELLEEIIRRFPPPRGDPAAAAMAHSMTAPGQCS